MNSVIIALCVLGGALLVLAFALFVVDLRRRWLDLPVIASHVEHVQGGLVRVNATDPASRELVRSLGASGSLLGRDSFTLPYDSDEALARLLTVLRDAGFALGHQAHGWPPSAIFEDLRDRGLVSGTFLAISWTGPGETVITTR